MADKLNIELKNFNGKKIKIAIILPYFNEKIGMELFKNCKKELLQNNIPEKNIQLFRVPGCLEIPLSAKKIIKKYDGIIALVVVIRWETKHFELVTETTYSALMNIQLEAMTPIIFEILACENLKQAQKRASEKGLNKGKEAAISALLQINFMK